jgi:hypothetical protein
MSRNHSTTANRQVERTCAAQREASLAALERELHGGHPPVADVPLINLEKARRAKRRELNALHRRARAERASGS